MSFKRRITDGLTKQNRKKSSVTLKMQPIKKETQL